MNDFQSATTEATEKAKAFFENTTTAAKDAAEKATIAAKDATAQATLAAKVATEKTAETVEATVAKIRELNEQAIKTAKEAGITALNAYQTALEAVVAAEYKVADSSQVEWFKTLVTTQADFTQKLGSLYLSSVREQLN